MLRKYDEPYVAFVCPHCGDEFYYCVTDDYRGYVYEGDGSSTCEYPKVGDYCTSCVKKTVTPEEYLGCVNENDLHHQILKEMCNITGDVPNIQPTKDLVDCLYERSPEQFADVAADVCSDFIIEFLRGVRE